MGYERIKKVRGEPQAELVKAFEEAKNFPDSKRLVNKLLDTALPLLKKVMHIPGLTKRVCLVYETTDGKPLFSIDRIFTPKPLAGDRIEIYGKDGSNIWIYRNKLPVRDVLRDLLDARKPSRWELNSIEYSKQPTDRPDESYSFNPRYDLAITRLE